MNISAKTKPKRKYFNHWPVAQASWNNEEKKLGSKILLDCPFMLEIIDASVQGWEFAHLLIAHFTQIKCATVSNSLFAQIALDK